MQKKKQQTIIRGIPKTEIHVHLEAVASVDTIWMLREKHNLSLPGIKTKNDLVKQFNVSSLDEFISLYINVIQACFQTEDDIRLQIKDAKEYFQRNNIVYAEVHFALSKFILNGLDHKKIFTILDDGAKELRTDGITVKYIIDVSRSYGTENAMNNLDLTLGFKKESIIGIGLGGAEKNGRAKDYTSIFSKARDSKLHVVAHAGEVVDSHSIWEALNDLKAERIGHGISAIKDEKLMDYLRDTQIPLEVCPTSNLFTKAYATTYKNHPVRKFFDHGMYVTVNSDDPTLFGSDLNDEYIHLLENDIFTFDEIIQLIKNNIYATFLPEKEKDLLWEKVQNYLSAQ
ncbi:MAG: adenosine deaminase [Spirochaetales bacterium]|nr:adenosine deaminase [Spirochaetales bacterium]